LDHPLRGCAVTTRKREPPPSPRGRGEGWGEGQSQQICLGVVTGPHGVQGAVRIKSFTEEPEHIAHYGPLMDETGDRCAS